MKDQTGARQAMGHSTDFIDKMDEIMIENNFHPVKETQSVNSDQLVSMYKCQRKGCKAPYEPIVISGLEQMQNSSNIEEFVIRRCCEKIVRHDHEAV
jgi:hypothetical protein